MAMIPPGMSIEESDRLAIEEIKARRAANPNPRTYPSERIRRLIADLQARFEQAGRADPEITAQVLAELRAEEPT